MLTALRTSRKLECFPSRIQPAPLIHSTISPVSLLISELQEISKIIKNVGGYRQIPRQEQDEANERFGGWKCDQDEERSFGEECDLLGAIKKPFEVLTCWKSFSATTLKWLPKMKKRTVHLASSFPETMKGCGTTEFDSI